MTNVVLNPKARNALIMGIFTARPPMSLNALARECIIIGVFNQQDREEAFFSWAVRTVHDVLRKGKGKDRQGLPLAGRTGSADTDGNTVWAIREMWDLDAYKVNIDDHVKLGIGAIRAAQLLAAECEDRWGERPEVPTLS